MHGEILTRVSPYSFAASIFLISTPVFALTDLTFYSDAGCSGASPVVSSSWVSCSKAGAVANTGNLLPVSCSVFYKGTDAIDLNVATGLVSGGWYDIGIAMPDWGVKSLAGYADLRFWTKNILATPAKFSIHIAADSNRATGTALITIPANQDWTEQVLQLSSLGNFASLNNRASTIVLDNPPYTAGVNSITHVYIDNLRITDGSGTGSLTVPSSPGGKVPAGWPGHLASGTSDATIDEGSTLPANCVDYRNHYLTWDWGSNNHWYGYIGRFIANGKTLNTKSSFVWYLLTKMEGSGSGLASYNRLAKLDTMTLYFNYYDAALAEMAAANQAGIALVLEPDFFGFMLDQAKARGISAADIPVRMDRANQLAGTTYPNTLKGLCQYMVYRTHQKLPGSIVGPLMSHWNIMGGLGKGSLDAHLAAGLETATFLNTLDSAGKGDVFFVEKADRDAGQTGDSSLFWSKADYDKYFAWVKMISNRTNLRCCGWQISEGNMQNAIVKNRDDAVQYFVSNCQDWVNAGFIGALFGGAAPINGVNNAYYQNDNKWFVTTMTAFHANACQLVVPVELPSVSAPRPLARMTIRQRGDRVEFLSIDPASVPALFSGNGKLIALTKEEQANRLSVVGLTHGMYFLRLVNPASGRSVTYQFVK